jgi:hypothetical protein
VVVLGVVVLGVVVVLGKGRGGDGKGGDQGKGFTHGSISPDCSDDKRPSPAYLRRQQGE